MAELRNKRWKWILNEKSSNTAILFVQISNIPAAELLQYVVLYLPIKLLETGFRYFYSEKLQKFQIEDFV